MELQLIDESSTFWEDNFSNLARERQAGAFTHVLSVVFAQGAYLWGLAEAATHGRRCAMLNIFCITLQEFFRPRALLCNPTVGCSCTEESTDRGEYCCVRH